MIQAKLEQRKLVMGDNATNCIECHQSEVESWQKTKHFANKDLDTNPKTEEIAANMGISPDLVHESALCSQCHFTVKDSGGSLEIQGGVSCESCHGGASEWFDIHNKKDRREGEDTRAQTEDAIAHGMIHPGQIHEVASNCYSCHIVTDEKLVKTGGHPVGSTDFELVKWLKGEVRHNFFEDQKANPEAPVERQRVQFVVGKFLDLEYSLRGLARASGPGEYGNAMGQRCVNSRKFVDGVLKQLGDAAPAELREALEKASTPGLLNFGNGTALVEAADVIDEKVAAFVENVDPATLDGLDPFIEQFAAEGEGDVYHP